MGKVISFDVVKGGVGKTTACINFAHILSVANYRILVVDFDEQKNTTDIFMNHLPYAEPRLDVLLTKKLASKDDIYENFIYDTNYDNISCIPGNLFMDQIGANISALHKTETDIFMTLRHNIALIKDDFDYIIFDNSAHSLGLSECSICASDDILCPNKVDSFSYKGITQILQKISQLRTEYGIDFNFRGVFLNDVTTNSNGYKSVFSKYQKNLGNLFIPLSIRHSVVFGDSTFFFTPLLLFDKHHATVDDYIKLLLYLEYIDMSHLKILQDYINAKNKLKG